MQEKIREIIIENFKKIIDNGYYFDNEINEIVSQIHSHYKGLMLNVEEIGEIIQRNYQNPESSMRRTAYEIHSKQLEKLEER